MSFSQATVFNKWKQLLKDVAQGFVDVLDFKSKAYSFDVSGTGFRELAKTCKEYGVQVYCESESYAGPRKRIMWFQNVSD